MSGWWLPAALACCDAVLWVLVWKTPSPSRAERRLWRHTASPRPVRSVRAAHLSPDHGAAGWRARYRRRQADLLALAGLAWEPGALDALACGGAVAGALLAAAAAQFAHFSGGAAAWAAGCAGGAGYLAPGLWVLRRAKERLRAFRRALPDALDVLSICLRAGLGLQPAVAEYARTAHGPSGEALRRYLRDLALGASPEQALEALGRRYPSEDVGAAVAVLGQGLRLGTPLADVLSEQAAHLRALSLRRAEEAARGLTSRLVLPLAAFIFPAVFIIGLGPVLLRLLEIVGGLR